MKTSTFLLGLALAVVSCGQGSSTTGYTIKGTVKNCGNWSENGHVILITRNNGTIKADTADVINGRFTLTGHVSTPDFASMYPMQADPDRPAGRIYFFLENEKYSVKIMNREFNGDLLKGGTCEKLLREVSQHQAMLDEKYSIESIDRQLNTTLTPAYRIEKLKAARHEYDCEVKAFRDSIIKANTPSYFSLYLTSIMIDDEINLDSIRQVLEIYLQDSRYKDDLRLKEMIEITERKRRP